MLYHLDALNGTSRNASTKYRYLSRCFSLTNIPREYAWEIAVLVGTPGILPRHVCAFMKWHPRGAADMNLPAGVSWHPGIKSWRADAVIDGKSRYLGSRYSIEGAAELHRAFVAKQAPTT